MDRFFYQLFSKEASIVDENASSSHHRHIPSKISVIYFDVYLGLKMIRIKCKVNRWRVGEENLEKTCDTYNSRGYFPLT